MVVESEHLARSRGRQLAPIGTCYETWAHHFNYIGWKLAPVTRNLSGHGIVVPLALP